MAERVRRMLKNGETDNSTFIRDVTTLVDMLEGVDKIIFKEEGNE